jgi:hypothetical protein
MRPRDLAQLLLSSEELRPRRRLRSQYPDNLGMELKRSLLQAIADLDPNSENLEATLTRLVNEIGPAPGPVRALAIGFRDDWNVLSANPEWLEQLREEAAREGGNGSGQQLHS